MCELVNYEIVGNRSRPEWPERPERPEWPSWASFGNGLPCRPCTSTSLFPNPFPGHVRGLPGCCCWVAICYLERPLICFNQKLPHRWLSNFQRKSLIPHLQVSVNVDYPLFFHEAFDQAYPALAHTSTVNCAREIHLMPATGSNTTIPRCEFENLLLVFVSSLPPISRHPPQHQRRRQFAKH